MYNPSHGYYMCYRKLSGDDAGRVFEKIGAAAEVVQKRDGSFVDFCEFSPVKSASFYVVYAVGGGGGGGGGSIGGAPGEFMTLFVTNIADSLRITPGTGGAKGSDGTPTVIENSDSLNILSVKGGLAGSESRVRQELIRNCEVVPLASFISDSSNQNYIKQNSSDSSIRCDITSDGVVATMCPRDDSEIRQDDKILKFFKWYAKAAKNFYTNPAGGVYKDVPSDSSNKNNDIALAYKFNYTADGCITGLAGGSYEDSERKRWKYCKRLGIGDKLYSKGWNDADSRYALDRVLPNTCKTVTIPYNSDDMKIKTDVDSATVVRTKSNLKFILDMQYDMSKFNNTQYIKPSGFGEYITNSSLKDSTTAVLFDEAGKPNTNSATKPEKQFIPSMGDGGHSEGAGYPGAVFIAW